MYLCICIYMFVCMYVCMYVCKYCSYMMWLTRGSFVRAASPVFEGKQHQVMSENFKRNVSH